MIINVYADKCIPKQIWFFVGMYDYICIYVNLNEEKYKSIALLFFPNGP